MPALGVGDQEIAENLDARHRLEFFRVDEKGIERERVLLAEKLHQPAVFLHQVVRQDRNPQPALAGAQHAEQARHAEAPEVILRCPDAQSAWT
jgi:hypothetical protein